MSFDYNQYMLSQMNAMGAGSSDKPAPATIVPGLFFNANLSDARGLDNFNTKGATTDGKIIKWKSPDRSPNLTERFFKSLSTTNAGGSGGGGGGTNDSGGGAAISSGGTNDGGGGIVFSGGGGDPFTDGFKPASTPAAASASTDAGVGM